MQTELTILEQDVLKKRLNLAENRITELEEAIDKFFPAINSTPPWESSAVIFAGHLSRLVKVRHKETDDGRR